MKEIIAKALKVAARQTDKHGDTKKPLALKGYASGGEVQGLAGGGSNWRASAAPYGLQQLAYRLGYSVDDLINNPQIVAAAVAQMEDPRGANHVAESFMDMYDRNGGGRDGLMRTIAGYDTMTMRNGRTIGSLPGGDINQTIANLNTGAMQPTVQHLSDVTSGVAERILPEGYTQNFSPAAARVQPIRPGTWGYYQTPQGQSVYAPVWAAPAIRAGTYTMTPSGEYMVPDASQKPFQVSWSRPQTPDNGLPNNSSIATAQPQMAPQAPQVASAAPVSQPMALGRGPSDLPPMTFPKAPPPYPGDEPSNSSGNYSAKPKSSGADWVESGLGLVPKWGDDSTSLQPLGFADGGAPSGEIVERANMLPAGWDREGGMHLTYPQIAPDIWHAIQHLGTPPDLTFDPETYQSVPSPSMGKDVNLLSSLAMTGSGFGSLGRAVSGEAPALAEASRHLPSHGVEAGSGLSPLDYGKALYRTMRYPGEPAVTPPPEVPNVVNPNVASDVLRDYGRESMAQTLYGRAYDKIPSKRRDFVNEEAEDTFVNFDPELGVSFPGVTKNDIFGPESVDQLRKAWRDKQAQERQALRNKFRVIGKAAGGLVRRYFSNQPPHGDIPQLASGGVPYPGDEGRYAVLEADSVPTLDDYAPLRNFQPFRPAELRGNSPGSGESRDPFADPRAQQYLQPAYEGASPAVGGYGMGQGIGEFAKDAYDLASESPGLNQLTLANTLKAAGSALPLVAMAVAPGAREAPLAREIDTRGFYSPTLEAAKGLPQEKGTVGQFRSMLLDPKYGGKPKELSAVGFDQAFPDPNAKVSRSDIETFLRENRVGLGQTDFRETPSGSYARNASALRQRMMDEGMRSDQVDRHVRSIAEGRRPDSQYIGDDPEVARLEQAVRESYSTPTRFEQWSTPGGIQGSYGENVTTLPNARQRAVNDWKIQPGEHEGEIDVVNEHGRPVYTTTDHADAQQYIDRERGHSNVRDPGSPDTYTSTHWPGITNPLLHYRTKDFYTNRPDATFSINPAGSDKTRVLEEMQSDWAQRARDQGTRDPAAVAALQKAENDHVLTHRQLLRDAAAHVGITDNSFDYVMGHLRARFEDDGDNAAAAFHKQLSDSGDRLSDLRNKVDAAKNGVPYHPLIKDTSTWVDLGLKQALMEAAKDPSVSKFAWAPGTEHVRRYPSLSTVVDEIGVGKPEADGTRRIELVPKGVRNGSAFMVDPQGQVLDGDYKGHTLHEVVGRDMADQLLATKGSDIFDGDRLNVRTAEGIGMGKFYGDFTPEGSYTPGIVGTRLSKLIKAVTGESPKIEPHRFPETKVKFEDRGKSFEERNQGYPSVSITPQMREALKKGLPLFSAAAAMGLTPDDQGSSGHPPAGDEVTPEQKAAFLKQYYGE